MARRDVPFWTQLAAPPKGRCWSWAAERAESRCRSAEAGTPIVGIDLSARMLVRARTRVRRARLGRLVHLVRGDIRHLPFPDGRFAS